MRAIYPYEAQGSDELSLEPGDILELSTGPGGGQSYGDGWWEGEDIELNDRHDPLPTLTRVQSTRNERDFP